MFTESIFEQIGCRIGSAAEEAGGQMTIFYCGQVNVYDGVSLDKVMNFKFVYGMMPKKLAYLR